MRHVRAVTGKTSEDVTDIKMTHVYAAMMMMMMMMMVMMMIIIKKISQLK
jgi:hypothetical protein